MSIGGRSVGLGDTPHPCRSPQHRPVPRKVSLEGAGSSAELSWSPSWAPLSTGRRVSEVPCGRAFPTHSCCGSGAVAS